MRFLSVAVGTLADVAAPTIRRVHAWDEQTGAGCATGCFLLVSPAQLTRRAQRFGVRVADLARLVAATGGLCMLCRRCHTSVVEHCHDLGIVRGLACRWCNNRVAALEGAHGGRPTVYPRGYSCVCVYGPALVPEDVRSAQEAALEAATYRFIDHAVDLATRTVAESFARLADRPYPDVAQP